MDYLLPHFCHKSAISRSCWRKYDKFNSELISLGSPQGEWYTFSRSNCASFLNGGGGRKGTLTGFQTVMSKCFP